MSDGLIWVAVEDLREGMRVDLEGDRYADPEHDVRLKYEYAEVVSVEQETPNCTVVGWEGGGAAFPRGYRVRVRAPDARPLLREALGALRGIEKELR